MPTFTINFNGLMVHIGQDSDTKGERKHRLAIVEAPHHAPHIVFDGKHLVTEPYAGIVAIPIEKHDLIQFNITDGNTADTAEAETNELFRRCMPKLSELTTGDLHKDVKDGKTNHPHVAAYLDYPGGKLNVEDTFKQPREFTLGSKVVRLCVPRTVELEVSHTASRILLIITPGQGTPETFHLAPDAQIAVVNVARGGRHFGHYKHLLGSGDIAKDDPVTDGGSCDTSTGEIQPPQNSASRENAATETENAHAGGHEHLPNPIAVAHKIFVVPRGDCGNTSWP